ncbi:MAG: hypothetical protein OHK0017_08090 [Patescibacteria group bacterium]
MTTLEIQKAFLKALYLICEENNKFGEQIKVADVADRAGLDLSDTKIQMVINNNQNKNHYRIEEGSLEQLAKHVSKIYKNISKNTIEEIDEPGISEWLVTITYDGIVEVESMSSLDAYVEAWKK